jgi:tetratricopeptide (TPR) repeat protein
VAEASELRRLGRLDEAEVLLRKALAVEPPHVAALTELGYLARARGDRTAALSAFEAASKAEPKQIGLKVAVACELHQLGRLDEAEALLQQALAVDARHVTALTELGYLARRRGDRTAALTAFEAAAAADPKQAGLKIATSSQLRQIGRLDEAEASLRQALAIEPQNINALTELGYLARARGDRTAALSAFEAASKAEPKQIGLKVAAATELRQLGRLEEAEVMLRQALTIEPQHLPSLLGIGHIARRRGDRASAEAAFQSAAAANRGDPGAALEVVNGLRDFGNFAVAESSFVEHLAVDPDNLTALVGLGSIRLEQLRLDEAEKIFRHASALAPHEPVSLLCCGYVARRRGDYEEALACFSAAHAANPSHSGAAIETAGQLRDLGRFAEARHVIHGILRRNPRDYAALMQLAHLSRKEGERRAALHQFTVAHEREPQQPQALVEMAIEQRALGNPQESEALLRRALTIFPSYLAALEQLAEHYFMAENFKRALRIARRSIATYPKRHYSYLLGCRASAELGNMDAAIGFLRHATEFAAPHPEIRATRASLYIQQRDWNSAYRLLTDPEAQTQRHTCLWTLLARLAITTGDYGAAGAALPNEPSTVHDASRVRLLRGQIAEARWDLELAAASYREAAALAPSDSAPHFELARVSLKLLDLNSCRFYLGRLIEIGASSLWLRGQSLNASQTHVGQILDEFALDAELLCDLRRIRSLPLEQQIAPLQEMVVANPQYTPAAMMLLIAKRQAGQLVRADSRPANRALDRIPKSIVQYWDDTEPPTEIAALMRSWKEGHPDFEYIRLDDRTAQVFLETHEMPDVLSAYRRARQPAQRADLIRLAYLSAKGGVYADADDRCIAAVGSFVPPDATFVAYQEDYGTLGNNFLAVIPGHPAICLALQLASEAVNRGDNDLLWLSTGPGVLSRAFAQTISRPQSDVSECLDATILDVGTVARCIGFHCPVLYKKTLRHWSRTSFVRRKQTFRRKSRAGSTSNAGLQSRQESR